MKTACMKWNHRLLEAALGEPATTGLENHLSQCAACAAELAVLRARRERMDKLLPLVGSAEPSPDLKARILAVAEASTSPRRSHFLRWAWAGIAAAIVIAVITALVVKPRAGIDEADLRGAQALAEWRSPTDGLLHLPGQQWLNSTPHLGEAYITMPIESGKGGSK
jgi:anti-sigma factor RsiW